MKNVPALDGVSAAVQPVPDTVAAIQLDGATLPEDESPTCTALDAGDTVPVNANAVPAIPLLGAPTMAIEPEDPPDCCTAVAVIADSGSSCAGK
jgi:hypothetical protein